jgi:hypothetical protein
MIRKQRCTKSALLRVIVVAIIALAVMVGACVCTSALAGSARVATAGDRHVVTAERLRSELRKANIEIRYTHPMSEPTAAVVGAARAAPAGAIGFEYQLFSSSALATIRYAGKLRPKDFGWPRSKLGVVFEPIVRGVLGNVAYAIYERHFLRQEGTREEATEVQLSVQRTVRAMDDALFKSFPPRDPYANALSTGP